MIKLLATLLTGAACAAAMAGAAATRVDADLLANAAGNSAEWLTHGRTYSEQRYSPLKRIDTATVQKLGLAWYFDLDTHRGQEATPLLIDGVLYFSTAWSKVFALDARTGEPRWAFDPRVPPETQAKVCCDVVNRGLAAWNDKLYVGALDGRLIALDRATGKPVWSVQTVDADKPYTITGAPRVVKGKVIIGNSGADMGVRGYVSAYDAESGKLVWRFYTVPGEPGKSDGAASDEIHERLTRATWAGEWWKHGGGGTAWDAIAYDPELALLYVGVGNGGPWDHRLRSNGRGDNLFLSSIVALEPDTGKYVWHFQTTPAESWDYTATQSIVLADLVIDGKPRKVLMQAPKNGFFYVLDRATGRFISGRNYVPVTWAKGLAPRTGRPLENAEARYERHPAAVLPGPSGAHNWHPMSFDPVAGIAYIPIQQLPSIYARDPSFTFKARGWNAGVDPMPPLPRGSAARALLEEPSGGLLAWDPVAQREVWRVTHRTVSNGGTLVTGGGLVFQGTSDGRFHAYSSRSGEALWSYDVQNAILGGPITYELDGEQYIAALAGVGGITPLVSGYLFEHLPRGQPGRLLVFKLGGTNRLPPVHQAARRALDLTRVEVDGDARLGERRYNEHCLVCHGSGAVSGPSMPDLRYSGAILEAAAFQAIVLEGALSRRGMVGFEGTLTLRDAEAIRAYLIEEARLTAERR